MTWGDIILLSVALAMDCFTVSIVSGVVMQRPRWGVMMRMATLFGLFQAAMPLAGWLCTSRFAAYVEDFDHWVAFALLAFVGGRMIRDSFRPEEESHTDPQRLQTQLVLAVATSIDALAVGISMAVTGYDTLQSLMAPLAAIGAGSLLFSLAGFMLGITFGAGIRRRLRPELLGGLILLFIGTRILLTHLLTGS
ncbi:MAG: manganese efflux pump [Prevotella sp.]|nr:manganese efflux pump [Prevotella sp.]